MSYTFLYMIGGITVLVEEWCEFHTVIMLIWDVVRHLLVQWCIGHRDAEVYVYFGIEHSYIVQYYWVFIMAVQSQISILLDTLIGPSYHYIASGMGVCQWVWGGLLQRWLCRPSESECGSSLAIWAWRSKGIYYAVNKECEQREDDVAPPYLTPMEAEKMHSPIWLIVCLIAWRNLDPHPRLAILPNSLLCFTLS